MKRFENNTENYLYNITLRWIIGGLIGATIIGVAVGKNGEGIIGLVFFIGILVSCIYFSIKHRGKIKAESQFAKEGYAKQLNSLQIKINKNKQIVNR